MRGGLGFLFIHSFFPIGIPINFLFDGVVIIKFTGEFDNNRLFSYTSFLSIIILSFILIVEQLFKKREMKNSLTKFVLRKFTKLYLDFKNKSFYGQ